MARTALVAASDALPNAASSCACGSTVSKDTSGVDLNMFLTNDVKGGIEDSIGAYFATKRSFPKIYGEANPVPGIGKEAYSAFDDASSIPQGSLLVLDGKNHAALVLAKLKE